MLMIQQCLCRLCDEPIPVTGDDAASIRLFGVSDPCICLRPGNPLSFWCPHCGSLAGEPCATPTEVILDKPHKLRVKALKTLPHSPR